MDTTGFAFPFSLGARGRVATSSGDDHIRGKIVQILLTAPGERVGLPEFGCGLHDLVFDPNNDILAAATEFAINRSLQQWAGDEIVVQSVDVSSPEGSLVVKVVYLRRDSLEPGVVRISF